MFTAPFELAHVLPGDTKLSPYICSGKHSLSLLLSNRSSKEGKGLVETVVKENGNTGTRAMENSLVVQSFAAAGLFTTK